MTSQKQSMSACVTRHSNDFKLKKMCAIYRKERISIFTIYNDFYSKSIMLSAMNASWARYKNNDIFLGPIHQLSRFDSFPLSKGVGCLQKDREKKKRFEFRTRQQISRCAFIFPFEQRFHLFQEISRFLSQAFTLLAILFGLYYLCIHPLSFPDDFFYHFVLFAFRYLHFLSGFDIL